MKIKNIIQKIISSDPDQEAFELYVDECGISLKTVPGKFAQCREGNCSALMLHQYVYLKMLEEQGHAIQVAHGFSIPAESAVALEPDAGDLLELPPLFEGQYRTRIEGLTGKNSFGVMIIPVMPDGSEISHYKINGPFLEISSTTAFLMTQPEFSAFIALGQHNKIDQSEQTEHDNLKLVGILQQAKSNGMPIELAHFNNLNIVQPEKVGIAVAELEDGSLQLTPTFGTAAHPDMINARLGQLSGAEQEGTLRVGDQIIVVDEEKFAATAEVLSARRIPANRVNDFIKSPSAFIDASLVDLDAGFSIRVKGATRYVFVTNEEIESSGIDWLSGEIVHFPEILTTLVSTEEDLSNFETIYKQAEGQGSEELQFAGARIDITDQSKVKEAVENTREKIRFKIEDFEPDVPEHEVGSDTPIDKTTVLLEDEEFEFDDIGASIEAVSYKGELVLEGVSRQAYPHQEEGILWMLGMIEKGYKVDPQDSNRVQGAIMADDMGLGKTYMSLVGVDQYYRWLKRDGRRQKPVLVVAPLSLLENWEDEVSKTFSQSPFSDVVILQSARDLKRFRLTGTKSETWQKIDDEEILDYTEIRYALKIGKHFGDDRLDRDGRLVLATYQALRDYQFSLCRVDWSLVIFDEAQNIKNPNTLQTRAAKGLKAEFKLLATGTPVENNLYDFWCLMDTAQPQLLGNKNAFRNAYVNPIKDAQKEDKSQITVLVGKKLRAQAGVYMLRRLKEDELKGLPRKNIYSGVADDASDGRHRMEELAAMMAGNQLQLYNEIVQDFKKNIQEGASYRTQILVTLQSLKRVSICPYTAKEHTLLSGNAKEAIQLMKESAKAYGLLRLLEQIKKRNEKVIIFLIAKKMQRLLGVWLQQIYRMPVNVINGDTKAVSAVRDNSTRKGIIEEFEKREGFGILVMSPIAAGVGLTIVGANNVIHLERHWNPAKEAQATDRVYRIGQTKDVNVYLPTLHHPQIKSFDVNLDMLLRNKTDLKDAVVTPQIATDEELANMMQLA